MQCMCVTHGVRMQYVVAYLCREESLFLSSPIPSRPKKRLRISNLTKKMPRIENPRESLPKLEVSRRMVATKTKEMTAGGKNQASLTVLHNVVFCRFLLGYLEEPPYQIKVLEFCLRLLGVPKFLAIVEETLRVVRSGGLLRKDNQPRTAGGVFFEIIRRTDSYVYKCIRKYRKKLLEVTRQEKPQRHETSHQGKRKQKPQRELTHKKSATF